MPAIAQIGTTVLVTPQDDVQIVSGPSESEFVFVGDRSPFSVRVEGLLKDADEIVGVFGEVTKGHVRYFGKTATLFVRLDNSDWRRDNVSAAGFKVGNGAARLNGKYPYYNPLGSDMEGFPYLIRFGSLDSREPGELTVDSAMEAFQKAQAEPAAAPNGGPAVRCGDADVTGGPPSVS